MKSDEFEEAKDTALYRLLQAYLCILRGDYKNAEFYAKNALTSINFLVEVEDEPQQV